jgi:hypothetical protein
MFMIDITHVRPLTSRRLELKFADGLEAVVDLDQVIGHYNGVFSALLDDGYFRQVALNQELGTIFWPNGADLCPDVLYSFASGNPIMVNGRRVLN